MSYVLLTAVPLIGHLNPLLRQGEELRSRGWDVAIGTFRDLRGHVESEGGRLSFVDLGPLGPLRDSWRLAMEDVSREPSIVRGALQIQRALWRFWRPMFDELA